MRGHFVKSNIFPRKLQGSGPSAEAGFEEFSEKNVGYGYAGTIISIMQPMSKDSNLLTQSKGATNNFELPCCPCHPVSKTALELK